MVGSWVTSLGKKQFAFLKLIIKTFLLYFFLEQYFEKEYIGLW
jgi:hypothetical protein